MHSEISDDPFNSEFLESVVTSKDAALLITLLIIKREDREKKGPIPGISFASSPLILRTHA